MTLCSLAIRCPPPCPAQAARRRCWSVGTPPPGGGPTCPAWAARSRGWRPAPRTRQSTRCARRTTPSEWWVAPFLRFPPFLWLLLVAPAVSALLVASLVSVLLAIWARWLRERAYPFAPACGLCGRPFIGRGAGAGEKTGGNALREAEGRQAEQNCRTKPAPACSLSSCIDAPLHLLPPPSCDPALDSGPLHA